MRFRGTQMPVRKWTARIRKDKQVEELGTVEAQSHREAYLAAIEKFKVSIEQQSRLLVWA
jgi:hypothetical protein